VTQLLGDLFGILTHSECCFDDKGAGSSSEFDEESFGFEFLKIGHSRIDLNYYLTDGDIDYICDAIKLIAKYGWLFLPSYSYEPSRKLWVSKGEKRFETHSRLSGMDFS